jgi:hypothetical protein
MKPANARVLSCAFFLLLLTACARQLPPQATPTPSPTPEPAIYANQAGGFSLTLPDGWAATETDDAFRDEGKLLGQVILGPEPLTAPAGLIGYADARSLTPDQALALICDGQRPSLPAIAETTLHGRPAWTATVCGQSWTVVDNGDVTVFFRISDPETQAPLEPVIDSLRFTPVIDRERRTQEAATALQQTLARFAGETPDAVRIESVTSVTWPDACLGAPLAEESCAEVETPGYRIEISTPDGLYVYHFNPASTQIRLAAAPEPHPGRPLLRWSSPAPPCQDAVIGLDGLGFGACGGVQMPGDFVNPERQTELAGFATIYAPFDAQTPAGDITFYGAGPRMATPAEQRMLAEWARQVMEESAGANPDGSEILTWRRDGGVISACDGLTVDVTGRAQALSCRSGEDIPAGRRFLRPEELVQFYTWVDSLLFLDSQTSLPEAVDGLAVDLRFDGEGIGEATPADEQAMRIFAAAVFDAMADEAGIETTPAAALPGCPESADGMAILADQANGYCLSYPDAYDLFQPAPGQTVLGVGSLLDAEHSSLIIDVENADGRKLDDVEATLRAETGTDVEFSRATLGGEPALQVTGQPAPFADRRIITLRDGRLYSLRFFNGDKGEAAVEKLYETVVDSFTFLR